MSRYWTRNRVLALVLDLLAIAVGVLAVYVGATDLPSRGLLAGVLIVVTVSLASRSGRYAERVEKWIPKAKEANR